MADSGDSDGKRISESGAADDNGNSSISTEVPWDEDIDPGIFGTSDKAEVESEVKTVGEENNNEHKKHLIPKLAHILSEGTGTIASARSGLTHYLKNIKRGFSSNSDTRPGTGDLSDSKKPELRPSHLRVLYKLRKRRMKFIEKSMRHLAGDLGDDDVASVGSTVSDDEDGGKSSSDKSDVFMDEHTKTLSNKLGQVASLLREWRLATSKNGQEEFHLPLEVRMQDFSYAVMIKPGSSKIQNVYNSSFLYTIKQMYKKYWKREVEPNQDPVKKVILDQINLVIQPGKSYLVLGAPGSGKTTLLRAISGHVKKSKNKHRNKNVFLTGQILYNGRSLDGQGGDNDDDTGEEYYIQNAVQYIGQLDQHAPRLTVRETFEFAFQCKAGGTWWRDRDWCTPEQLKIVAKYDRENMRVQSILIGLGLDGVADTFVGNQQVRGVSGGQRRRVTVGEMLAEKCPVLCGDEISTGLDATSTYEMIELLLHFAKVYKTSRIIALLQPSPETVSLFDEIILLSAGRIIYAGPIMQVESYFESLGFKCPEHLDVADFLQTVSIDGGGQFYSPPPEVKEQYPYSSPENLAERFRNSINAEMIQDKLKLPSPFSWKSGEPEDQGVIRSRVVDMQAVKHRYANSTGRNAFLIFARFITLWRRDKRVIIAGLIKNILMGVSVGGVFFDNTNPIDLSGALFQAGLFIMLTAMQSAASLVVDRTIFFKHYESNFFSAVPFVLGRTASSAPQTITDVIMFSTLLYYIIGLADRDEPSNFLIYLAILIAFAFTMQQQLAFFASFSSSSTLQVLSAVSVLFYALFGGYIVAPDIIPDYYLWVYWFNPLAWAYRSLILNEFTSSRWNNSNQVLSQLGFTLAGQVYGKSWIYWSFAYMSGFFCISIVLCAVGLTVARESVVSKTLQIVDSDDVPKTADDSQSVSVPFNPVTLSFHDISYEVQGSVAKGKLCLLNGISGIFRPGRMCALMGSSGAGKTTLMDVIALRKRSGEIKGEVRLNGWPQDKITFRRCSGYVEQFDVQTPELTVRETVLFSARLRLPQIITEDDDKVQVFVDQVIANVDLSKIRHALVGTEETGLTFEQKKLLSIAVELAASPSLLFLDEPTSGLDSRSALIVAGTLRKIADEGRTVIATIHQPSSTVFEMFDELLLLKTGGHVVYHGELGASSSTLVKYFHSLGAPRIEVGDNPANWMFRVMARDDMKLLDQSWLASETCDKLMAELSVIQKGPPAPRNKILFDSEFAVPRMKRQKLVTSRLWLIYWRSPAYNLARLTTSAIIAFVLGSVFITQRHLTTYTETQMQSRFSVIFLSFIITGIMAILSVMPVMRKIRDMFYRHRSSGTYDSLSLGWALGSVEKIFIVLSCVIFVVVLQVTGRLSSKYYAGGFGFWGFFTFNFAIYSYFGQLFVCLVEPTETALILSTVFIGLNNFFSGLIVRPQLMSTGFYALPYYLCPGHYVYEGLIVCNYKGDDAVVIADPGSEYFYNLGCTMNQTAVCSGNVNDFIQSFFGGQFRFSNVPRDALILGGVLALTRLGTWLALKYRKYG